MNDDGSCKLKVLDGGGGGGGGGDVDEGFQGARVWVRMEFDKNEGMKKRDDVSGEKVREEMPSC